MTEVVAALIWDQNRFMICQRPKHKARGLLWEFVGGKTEPGETLQEALVRECREELNIQVHVAEPYLQVLHEYPDISIRLTLFHCTVSQGIPELLEHEAIAWITPEEIPNYHFCPADYQILTQIRHDFGTK